MCIMTTFKIYSHINFQVYNTALLTIVTLLYISCLELISLVTGSLYPLTKISHFQIPQGLGNHLSTLCMSSAFLDSLCRWDYTVFVLLCLTFSVSLTSRSIQVDTEFLLQLSISLRVLFPLPHHCPSLTSTKHFSLSCSVFLMPPATSRTW